MKPSRLFKNIAIVILKKKKQLLPYPPSEPTGTGNLRAREMPERSPADEITVMAIQTTHISLSTPARDP